MVIVSPLDGTVKYAQVFDTYETSAKLDKFCDHAQKTYPDGTIVIAACMDDYYENLSEKSKSWFTAMGSQEIRKVAYREGFAFIGIKGKTVAHEKRGGVEKSPAFVSQIFKVKLDRNSAGAGSLSMRKAGNSGLEVSTLSLGTWQFGCKGKDDYW